jgi:hypothetical protein
MSINAPALVLTAAAMSAIARGGIVKHTNPADEGPSYEHVETLKFWTAIVAASGGIIAIDKWNTDLAKGLAMLWIVGGILVNGKTISTWLTGLGKGLAVK